MSRKAERFYATIRILRTCFNRLKSVADEMHRDLGVTASMRAVMEALADEGQQSVPEIARGSGRFPSAHSGQRGCAVAKRDGRAT